MNARLATYAAIAVLALPLAARAQEQTDPELAEAERQFTLGVADYQEGRLEDALVRFTRAHALSHAPELLYDIATIHERLRHDADALEAYETYLSLVPSSPDRAAIEARVRVLRSERAPEPVASEPADELPLELPVSVAPVPPGVDAPAGADPAPWVVTATGVALLAGGAVLVGLGAMDASTVETTTSWSEASSARDRSPILTVTGLSALGVGAVAVVVGVVTGLTATVGPVRVSLGPSSLTLSGTF